MKRPLIAALSLSLFFAGPALSAEKKAKKSSRTPSTLPPKSPMIVIPPATDPAIASGEAPKLISSEMSGRDLQFFTTAVDAGRFLAYLVELLQSRAESDKIKAVAAALAGTQEAENKQIARLAARKSWTVATETTAAQKAVGTELEKLSGSDFDKAVMDKVIAATRQSVSTYEAAAQSADADIQDFSQQMLPLAKEKLMLAERMTGAGKAAGQLFRTGAPPKPAGGATPAMKPAAPAGPGSEVPITPRPQPIPPPIAR